MNPTSPSAEVNPNLTLPLLRKLRWTAVVGQASTVAVTIGLLGIPLPTIPVGVCIGLTALSNLLLYRIPPGDGTRPTVLAGILAADVALLTALLHYTGGAHNPFTSFFLVHVALGSVALPPALALGITAECCAGFGLLFLGSPSSPRPGDTFCGVGPNLPLSLHLKGMLVAFVLTAAAIAGFVSRLQQACRRGEAAVATAKALAADKERFAALATLAGGAAHELGTPLGTITIAASELSRAAARHPEDTELADDAQLIQEEVRRCRLILDRLGDPTGDLPESVRIGEILEHVAARFSGTPLIITSIHLGASLVVPRQALVQALASLVKNALDASPAQQAVRLSTEWKAGRVEFIVADQGSGLSPDADRHAGEPFFTTKPPGKGVGLGLFLVRLLAQRLGGEFFLNPRPEGGTCAILRLPQTLPGASS